MRHRVCPGLLVLLPVVVAVAGCGGDPSPESASKPAAAQSASGAVVDPCTLVTKAEADEALGAPSTEDRPSEANHPPALVTCRYTAPRGQGLAVLTLMLRTGYSAAEAKTTFEGTREVGQTERVADLGDDAFWLLDQLWVLKGTRSLTLSGDIEKGKARQLASQALGRLQ